MNQTVKVGTANADCPLGSYVGVYGNDHDEAQAMILAARKLELEWFVHGPCDGYLWHLAYAGGWSPPKTFPWVSA